MLRAVAGAWAVLGCRLGRATYSSRTSRPGSAAVSNSLGAVQAVRLLGGDGNDLCGGLGSDILTGSTGRSRFDQTGAWHGNDWDS